MEYEINNNKYNCGGKFEIYICILIIYYKKVNCSCMEYNLLKWNFIILLLNVWLVLLNVLDKY